MDSLRNIFLMFAKISRRGPDQSVDKRGSKFNWLVVCRVRSFCPPWMFPSRSALERGRNQWPCFLEEVCVSDRCSQCLDPASWSQAGSPFCPQKGNQGRWLVSHTVLPLSSQPCICHLESQLPQPTAKPKQNNSSTKKLKANTLIQTSPVLVSVCSPPPLQSICVF